MPTKCIAFRLSAYSCRLNAYYADRVHFIPIKSILCRPSALHSDQMHVHADQVHVHADQVHVHADQVHVHADQVHIHADQVHIHADQVHIHADQVHCIPTKCIFTLAKHVRTLNHCNPDALHFTHAFYSTDQPYVQS